MYALTGRAFVNGDPYLIDTADVLRMQDTGAHEDGTPVQDWVVMQTGVSCRWDSLRTRRYDLERRGNTSLETQEFAICFMPADTTVRPGDKLRFTAGPQAPNLVNVMQVEKAYGGFGVHHLEVQGDMISGQA